MLKGKVMSMWESNARPQCHKICNPVSHSINKTEKSSKSKLRIEPWIPNLQNQLTIHSATGPMIL